MDIILYMHVLMGNTLMTFDVFNDVQSYISLYFISNNIFNMFYWYDTRTKFAPRPCSKG